MIRYRYIEFGDSIGCEYTFEKAGEFLPSHQHPEHLKHSTLCVKGSAWLEVNQRWYVIKAQEELGEETWNSTHAHTLSALEDGTVIVNRLLARPHDAIDWLSDSGIVK